jgi:hypothetical protein
MSLKNKNYLIIRQALATELMDFCNVAFKIKRNAMHVLKNRNNFFGPLAKDIENWFGCWNDPQAPGHFSAYGDNVMESLLLMAHPLMEERTKMKLHPCYAYARIYEKGAELKKHTDRPSCEISCTVNMGGDMWPIYLKDKKKKIKVELKCGDMLIYKGIKLQHWREKFKKKECSQVFLHYVQKDGKHGDNFRDKRPSFGLPSSVVD